MRVLGRFGLTSPASASHRLVLHVRLHDTILAAGQAPDQEDALGFQRVLPRDPQGAPIRLLRRGLHLLHSAAVAPSSPRRDAGP